MLIRTTLENTKGIARSGLKNQVSISFVLIFGQILKILLISVCNSFLNFFLPGSSIQDYALARENLLR